MSQTLAPPWKGERYDLAPLEGGPAPLNLDVSAGGQGGVVTLPVCMINIHYSCYEVVMM